MPPGREPEVTVRSEVVDHDVIVSVSDNGLGIPAHLHERIFGMFERAHTGDKYEGTGIGLAIVRRAVERMGGAVGVESQPGQGSRFWVKLKQVTK